MRSTLPKSAIANVSSDSRQQQQQQQHYTRPIPMLLLLVFLLIQLLLISSIPTLGFFIDERHSPHQSDWSYDQQQEWQMDHKQCSLRAQSPIDIQRRFVIYNSQLKMHFYNYNQLTRFKIQNAHHTIKLNPISTQPFGWLHHLHRNGGGVKQYNNNNNNNNNQGIDSSNSSSAAPDLIGPDDEIEPEFEPASMGLPSTTGSVGGGGQHQYHNQHQQQQQQSRSQNQNVSQGGSFVENNDSLSSSSGGDEGSANQRNSQYNQQQQQQQQIPPYNGAPTIKLDWLDDGNNEFTLQDIHFHWAVRKDNGSEHAIDGRRASMEMHLVHIKNGLDKSQIGYTSDSVTVIAVLIESYRKSNADFNPIVNALNRINMTQKTQEIEYKSLYDLLPNALNNFYTYSGSLTTPPCYQVVNWIIMSDRLYLNAKQIEMFRNLYAPHHGDSNAVAASIAANRQSQTNHKQQRFRSETDDNQTPQIEPSLIMPNIRLLQPLNNRTILASFVPLSRLEQIQVFETAPYSGASSSLLLLNQAMVVNALIYSTCLVGTLINFATMNTRWL